MYKTVSFLGEPVAFQPILRRIHFLWTRYVQLKLVVIDPVALDPIGPDFPLRSVKEAQKSEKSRFFENLGPTEHAKNFENVPNMFL